MQIPVNLFIQSRNRFNIFSRDIFKKFSSNFEYFEARWIAVVILQRPWGIESMHNSKRIINVHILESIPRIECALHNILYTFIIEYHPNDFIVFYIFFETVYLREMFVSGSLSTFIDSVWGIKSEREKGTWRKK